MRTQPVVACLSMALILNIAAFDACLLASTTPPLFQSGQEAGGQGAGTADSLDVPEAAPGGQAVAPSAPTIAPPGSRDQLIFDDRDQNADRPARTHAPVYRKWWFWTAAASVAAAAVVLSVGGAEESRRDLPDFPNPPER